jgi:hypothetical protein
VFAAVPASLNAAAASSPGQHPQCPPASGPFENEPRFAPVVAELRRRWQSCASSVVYRSQASLAIATGSERHPALITAQSLTRDSRLSRTDKLPNGPDSRRKLYKTAAFDVYSARVARRTPRLAGSRPSVDPGVKRFDSQSEEASVIAITNFSAFWHPGQNTFGISIKLQDGRQMQLPINTPEEFIAVLAVLNGPAPALSPQGHVVCAR